MITKVKISFGPFDDHIGGLELDEHGLKDIEKEKEKEKENGKGMGEELKQKEKKRGYSK